MKNHVSRLLCAGVLAALTGFLSCGRDQDRSPGTQKPSGESQPGNISNPQQNPVQAPLPAPVAPVQPEPIQAPAPVAVQAPIAPPAPVAVAPAPAPLPAPAPEVLTPAPTAPVASLINALPGEVLLGNMKFRVPVDMHVTDLATSSTESGRIRSFQVVGANGGPGGDANYPEDGGSICQGGSFVDGQAPDGQWYRYCRRNVAPIEYKALTLGQAFNRIRVADTAHDRTLAVNVYDGPWGQVEFTFNRQTSTWLRLCAASPEKAAFVVPSMPQLFGWTANVVMLVCRSTIGFDRKFVAGFIHTERSFAQVQGWQARSFGGRPSMWMDGPNVTTLIDQHIFCGQCGYPRAAEIVYTESASGALLAEIAEQMQAAVLTHLRVRY